MERDHPSTVLLVRVPSAVCALPLSEVIETMRPLPVSPISDGPDFVCGVAIIRGFPTPVVELAALFQADEHPQAGRFVTVRCAGRTIALSVQSVIGIAELDRITLTSLSPLLKNARTDVIEAIGRLDAEFLVTLQTARLVPESVWKSLGHCEAAR
jgi:purine-binding chemotaxis protein CheW